MPKSGGIDSSSTVIDNEQLSFLPQSTQANSPRYRSLEPRHELSAAALQQWKEAMAKGRCSRGAASRFMSASAET